MRPTSWSLLTAKKNLPGGGHNGEALLEAVLGTICTEVKISETGEQTITDKRKPDGYWRVLGAPAHTQVAASCCSRSRIFGT
jgi:hypothetical protein